MPSIFKCEKKFHIAFVKTILEAPTDALRFAKESFISNSGKGFEESFIIEHDEAFRKVLLPKAEKGFK
jgi:enoyl-CoA hydratase